MRCRAWQASFQALLVPALLLVGSGVSAQTVVGRVVDRDTKEPLAAAFVALEDPAGNRQGGVLSGPDGRFVLRTTVPGRYQLVTDIIGYASAPADFVDLEAGVTVELTVEVPVRAITLDGIQVSSEARCRNRPGTGPETARLWDEARKALEITSWTGRNATVRFRGVRHERTLDPRTLRVVEATEAGWQSWSNRSPYASVPVEQLAEGGYVIEDEDGHLRFFAPDADVLLSELFLDEHCFYVSEAPDDEPGLLGLAFEPVRRGGPPDIRGVLWLDRSSAELRRLDFSYTDAPGIPARALTHAGGRVEFERLATGAWVVRRWWLRMPIVELRQPPMGRGGAPVAVVVAIHEAGGEVRSVSGRDGRDLAATTGAVLYGTVTDGATGQPLSDAVVEVVATGRTAVTGSEGAFRISDLAAGRYEVEVGHRDLDLMGLGPDVHMVDLEPGTATRLAAAIAPAPDLAAELCAASGHEARDPARGVVVAHGVVLDNDSVPVPDALISVSRPGSDAGAHNRVLADARGVYRTCFDVMDATVTLQAARGDRVPPVGDDGGERRLSLAAPGFLRADLVLPPDAGRTALPDGRAGGGAGLLGVAIEDGTRAPIAGATVSLVDGTDRVVRSAITDQAGQFQVAYPELGGAYRLRVEHLGYTTAEGPLRLERSDRVRVEVRLATRAIELDPIVVIERRRGFLADAGFYARRAQGMGVFVEVDEMQRIQGASVTDLLAGQRMIRVVRTGHFSSDVRIVGTERRGATPDGGAADCQPAIFVDGVLRRHSGQPTPEDPSLTDVVSSTVVAAIEVFRRATEVPPAFASAGVSCGVLVIWTR